MATSLEADPLTTVSRTGGTAPDSGFCAGRQLDPDLRVRIPTHLLDTLY